MVCLICLGLFALGCSLSVRSGSCILVGAVLGRAPAIGLALDGLLWGGARFGGGSGGGLSRFGLLLRSALAFAFGLGSAATLTVFALVSPLDSLIGGRHLVLRGRAGLMALPLDSCF